MSNADHGSFETVRTPRPAGDSRVITFRWNLGRPEYVFVSENVQGIGCPGVLKCMTARLEILFLVGLLLTAAVPGLALTEIADVSREQAGEMGLDVRGRKNGTA